MGKTTVLEWMLAVGRVGWAGVFVDLQGASTVEDLIVRWESRVPVAVRAAVAIRTAAPDVVRAAAGAVGAPASDAWRGAAVLLEVHLAMLPATDRLVVVLDEVPWWLDELERREPGAARSALAALRRLRHLWPERLRFVLTGSVGLAGLAADLGASAELNDLDVKTLPPLPVAGGCTVFELSLPAGSRVHRDAARAAHMLAGGSPFWIRELAQRVMEQDVGVDAVERAAAVLLQPALRHLFADQAREHFLRRDPRDVPVLGALLAAASADDAGVTEEALITAALAARADVSRQRARELVYRLSDAWYLMEEPPRRWRFAMPLFRRWWCHYGRDA